MFLYFCVHGGTWLVVLRCLPPSPSTRPPRPLYLPPCLSSQGLINTTSVPQKARVCNHSQGELQMNVLLHNLCEWWLAQSLCRCTDPPEALHVQQETAGAGLRQDPLPHIYAAAGTRTTTGRFSPSLGKNEKRPDG